MIKYVILYHIFILLTNKFLSAKSSKAEIKILHKKIPKPPQDYEIIVWIKWKTDIDVYNDINVWNLTTGSALNFVNQIHYELSEYSIKLNEYLIDKKLFYNLNKRRDFSQVLRYHYCSLRIVSTLQTFELESPPFIPPTSLWRSGSN